MTPLYIISSPGRCGSYLVASIALDYAKKHYDVSKDEEIEPSSDLQTLHDTDILDNLVAHAHHPLFTFKKPAHLVIVLRRDVFVAALSNAVAIRSNNWTTYKNEIEPFSLPLEDLEKYITWQNEYLGMHDFSYPYLSVTSMYYENFVNNYTHINDKLNIPVSNDVFFHSEKSSYDYTKIITNYDECLDYYRMQREQG